MLDHQISDEKTHSSDVENQSSHSSGRKDESALRDESEGEAPLLFVDVNLGPND
jgi:hypothetical protein